MSIDTADIAATPIEIGEVTLSVIDVGEGPTVLLLHGFPDRATMWRTQIRDLREAGYRVIAPDLRGFGDSSRPADPSAYAAPTLLDDIIGLLDHLGVGEFSVAAHDWGSLIGWVLAASLPDRVTKLAAFSVGHPRAYAGAGFPQKQLAWYILWWQTPGVAESALPVNDWEWFREWAYDGAQRSSDPDLDRQLTDLERDGALSAGLNYYRANLTPAEFADNDWYALADLPPVACPVMGVWGEDEMALTERQMTDSARYVTGPWR